jgi:hypothetical protein
MARKTRGKKTAAAKQSLMVRIEFQRADLADFVDGLKLGLPLVSDPDDRHFLTTAAGRISESLAVSGDIVACEAKVENWWKLAGQSLRLPNGGGRIGQTLLRILYLAQQREERLRETAERADQERAWKIEADALRKREAEELAKGESCGN